MGSKYASIHILDTHSVYTEQDIRKLYGKALLSPDEAVEKFIENYIKFSKALGEEEYPPQALIDLERRCAEEGWNKLQVIRAVHFWSIFDEDLSIQSVIKKAREISKKTDSPVVYVSNCDDSAFIMGVYYQGRCSAKLAIGEGLAEYGIKSSCTNLMSMTDHFDFIDESQIQMLRRTSDVFKAQEWVSDILEIPLINRHSIKL